MFLSNRHQFYYHFLRNQLKSCGEKWNTWQSRMHMGFYVRNILVLGHKIFKWNEWRTPITAKSKAKRRKILPKCKPVFFSTFHRWFLLSISRLYSCIQLKGVDENDLHFSLFYLIAPFVNSVLIISIELMES